MASAEELAQAHTNLAELSKRSVADSTDSAARPAPKLDGPSTPRSEQECSEQEFSAWLKALPALTIAQCEPIERLEGTITLLQSCYSRQQRRKVQQLLASWDVSQKTKGRKRNFDEVKADLIAKAVEETRRLETMQDAHEPVRLGASATIAGTCFSAIQIALHHGNMER